MNGWKNRVTWTVNLHLMNDYGAYENVRALVRGKTLHDAADAIELYVRETETPVEPSLGRDLLSAALIDVDWEAIAEDFLE
jgi:hypothetical protein